MDTARKEAWREYRRSLMISLAISSVFLIIILRVQPGANWLVLVAMALFSGFVFGTSFYTANAFIAPRLRHRSFALTLLGQTALFCGVIGVCFSLVTWMIATVISQKSPFDPGVLQSVWVRITSPQLAVWALAAYGVALVISGYFQISAKLGPGVLKNWVTGKYHEPREEERIFMFLDMKNSTTLAEKLGNLRFSALVRDFFQDLTYPAIEAKAEVSHYVGDEAVLTWVPLKGLAKDNCIRFFFLMEDAIQKRRKHYLEKYGLVPEFKAGAHIGPVVATEVGQLKSEIVYHGDVLNTSARIQSMCNELGSILLVSGELASRLSLLEYGQVSLGRYLLKGKEQDVEIISVTRLADRSEGALEKEEVAV